jgi:hypothetical protein
LSRTTEDTGGFDGRNKSDSASNFESVEPLSGVGEKSAMVSKSEKEFRNSLVGKRVRVAGNFFSPEFFSVMGNTQSESAKLAFSRASESSDLLYRELSNVFVTLIDLPPIVTNGPKESVGQAIEKLYLAERSFNERLVNLGFILEANRSGTPGQSTVIEHVTVAALIASMGDASGKRTFELLKELKKGYPSFEFVRLKWTFEIDSLSLDFQLKSAVCVVLRYILAYNFRRQLIEMKQTTEVTSLSAGLELELKEFKASINGGFKNSMVYDTAFLQNLYRTIICTLLPADPQLLQQQREHLILKAFDLACGTVFTLVVDEVITQDRKDEFFKFVSQNLRKSTFLVLLMSQVNLMKSLSESKFPKDIRKITQRENIRKLTQLQKELEKYQAGEVKLVGQLETFVLIDSVLKSFKEL